MVLILFSCAPGNPPTKRKSPFRRPFFVFGRPSSGLSFSGLPAARAAGAHLRHHPPLQTRDITTMAARAGRSEPNPQPEPTIVAATAPHVAKVDAPCAIRTRSSRPTAERREPQGRGEQSAGAIRAIGDAGPSPHPSKEHRTTLERASTSHTPAPGVMTVGMQLTERSRATGE